MADEDAPEMYITGIAGTGKTTSLDVLVRHCIANDISYNVMAYTHKACGVLRTKLVGNANISTLHSFLVKRPTINMEATKVRHLEGNTQMGDPDRVKVCISRGTRTQFSPRRRKVFCNAASLEFRH